MPIIRLEQKDWVEAGLRTLGAEGIAGLNIDRMCAQLKVTKGSFYHHFKNRVAFVQAVVDEWERRVSDEIIEQAETVDEPAGKLAKLGEWMTAHVDLVIGELGVIQSSTDPLVAAAVRRVAGKRLQFLLDTCAEMDFEPAEARHASAFMYAIYYGTLQLMATAPDWLESEEGLKEYIGYATQTMLTGILAARAR